MGENKDIEINLMRREAVGDFLKRSAERLPNKTAMVFGDKRFTYSEFNSTVNRFAHVLMDVGIRKGDVVSLTTHQILQISHYVKSYLFLPFSQSTPYSTLCLFDKSHPFASFDFPSAFVRIGSERTVLDHPREHHECKGNYHQNDRQDHHDL
jgi:hypothetical protein